MFEPTRDDRIVQRGIDEALACRDALAAVPAKPSRLTRLIALLGTRARRFVTRHLDRRRGRPQPAGAEPERGRTGVVAAAPRQGLTLGTLPPRNDASLDNPGEFARP